MILSCPNCGTQYVVKDGAIPPEGRQVRCAACKHSWHQDPEAGIGSGPDSVSEGETEEAAPCVAPGPPEQGGEADETSPTDDESLAEAILIEPRSGPDAEQRAYDETVIEEAQTDASPAIDTALTEGHAGNSATPTELSGEFSEPPSAAPDTFSPFADDGEGEQRRRSPVAAILVFVLIVVVAAALFWFLAPTALKAKLGITAAAATPLQLVTTHMDRTPLESGNELLTVTGRVINPSPKEQDVPPLQAQLKDHQGKIVYSWTIQPPAHSLAAGASASFNSAEVNVPPGGDELTITLGEPKS